ncbi:hypothetical protein E2C01_095229 [Portunus trituberculatus]|uniref:Uncharacterized protein n=1 Tax=Portunus trituberculatus TaxID=210409 RepID=A0A5B7JP99_PORTR|nr:hypothetical protein [Portunus trituberculatus]
MLVQQQSFSNHNIKVTRITRRNTVLKAQQDDTMSLLQTKAQTAGLGSVRRTMRRGGTTCTVQLV